MNERRDDLQEIMDKALEEMAAEAGEGFDPQACNLADLCRRTGLTRSRARTTEGHGFRVLPHGNTGRKAGTTVPAGHTGLVDDLLGRGVADSQATYGRLVGQGCRGGLTSVRVYVAARMDLVPARGGAVAPQGSRYQRFVTGPGQAYQTGRGFVTVVGLDGAERKIACLAMVCHHCGSPHVELFPNARQGSLPMGMVHAFMAMGIPGEVLADNMRPVVVRRVGNPTHSTSAPCSRFQTGLPSASRRAATLAMSSAGASSGTPRTTKARSIPINRFSRLALGKRST